jgi:hypothetical protein
MAERKSLLDRLKQERAATRPEAFIAGANEDDHTHDLPWEAFNKKDVPRTTFNLRLNDYELTLLRWLAEQRDESMQKIAKRALIPALEQLAHETTADNS